MLTIYTPEADGITYSDDCGVIVCDDTNTPVILYIFTCAFHDKLYTLKGDAADTNVGVVLPEYACAFTGQVNIG